ncbi:MAG: hypothetical protein KTR31_41110 [Myxococcales bacterium]|nr:hypothetical protein [Myxococcales bacterium]
MAEMFDMCVDYRACPRCGFAWCEAHWPEGCPGCEASAQAPAASHALAIATGHWGGGEDVVASVVLGTAEGS